MADDSDAELSEAEEAPVDPMDCASCARAIRLCLWQEVVDIEKVLRLEVEHVYIHVLVAQHLECSWLELRRHGGLWQLLTPPPHRVTARSRHTNHVASPRHDK